MKKEDLLQEYGELLNVLVEKTKFIYSEEFYALSDFEKQKYTKDKMATEGHLNTLCNLLWSETPQFGSIADYFGLALISSMFGNNSGFGSLTSGTDLLKKELENANDTEVAEQ